MVGEWSLKCPHGDKNWGGGESNIPVVDDQKKINSKSVILCKLMENWKDFARTSYISGNNLGIIWPGQFSQRPISGNNRATCPISDKLQRPLSSGIWLIVSWLKSYMTCYNLNLNKIEQNQKLG